MSDNDLGFILGVKVSPVSRLVPNGDWRENLWNDPNKQPVRITISTFDTASGGAPYPAWDPSKVTVDGKKFTDPLIIGNKQLNGGSFRWPRNGMFHMQPAPGDCSGIKDTTGYRNFYIDTNIFLVEKGSPITLHLEDYNGNSVSKQFTVPNANADYSVFMMGDPAPNFSRANQQSMINVYNQYKGSISLNLFNGDNFYNTYSWETAANFFMNMGSDFEMIPSIATMGNHDYECCQGMGESLYPSESGLNLDQPYASASGNNLRGCWVPASFGQDGYKNAWDVNTKDYDENNGGICGNKQGVPAGWTLGLYPWGRSAFLTVDNVYKVEWMLNQYNGLADDLQKAINDLKGKGVTEFYLVSHWDGSSTAGSAEHTASALDNLQKNTSIGSLFQDFKYITGHSHGNNFQGKGWLIGGNGFDRGVCCPSVLEYKSGGSGNFILGKNGMC